MRLNSIDADEDIADGVTVMVDGAEGSASGKTASDEVIGDEHPRAIDFGGGQSGSEISGPLLLRRILLSTGRTGSELFETDSCLVWTCFCSPDVVL